MKPPLILAVCVLVISIASVAGNMSALVLDGFIFDRAMVLIQMNDCCLFCLSLLLLLFLTKTCSYVQFFEELKNSRRTLG